MLFADDAAVATHTHEGTPVVDGLLITGLRGLRTDHRSEEDECPGTGHRSPPIISIDNYELDAVCQFTYLGSTITGNLSLDAEIDKRIWKAASTLARLTARVWANPKLSVKTKMAVYNACVISTLLYGSEKWTT